MSHIKDRLTNYHDWMKKLTERHEMITSKDVLDMIEQLQDDMEQDEKEKGWIPVSERLPKESDYYIACIYDTTTGEFDFRRIWFCCEDRDWGMMYTFDKVTAWMPLPEPYKED